MEKTISPSARTKQWTPHISSKKICNMASQWTWEHCPHLWCSLTRSNPYIHMWIQMKHYTWAQTQSQIIDFFHRPHLHQHANSREATTEQAEEWCQRRQLGYTAHGPYQHQIIEIIASHLGHPDAPRVTCRHFPPPHQSILDTISPNQDPYIIAPKFMVVKQS